MIHRSLAILLSLPRGPLETTALPPTVSALLPLTISLKAIHESAQPASLSRLFLLFFFFSSPNLSADFPPSRVYIYIYPVSRSTHGFVGSWGYGSRRISIFGEQEEEEEVVTDNYGDRDLSGGVFEVLELELLTSVADLSFATFVILVIRLRKKVFRRDFLRLILSSSVVCSSFVSLSSKTKDKSMNKWFVRPVNRFEKRLEEVWRGARWLISEMI